MTDLKKLKINRLLIHLKIKSKSNNIIKNNKGTIYNGF